MQTNDNRSNNLKHKTLGGVAHRILSGLGTACRHNVGFAPKRIMKSTGEMCLHVSMLVVGFGLLVQSQISARTSYIIRRFNYRILKLMPVSLPKHLMETQQLSLMLTDFYHSNPNSQMFLLLGNLTNLTLLANKTLPKTTYQNDQKTSSYRVPKTGLIDDVDVQTGLGTWGSNQRNLLQ